MTREEEIEQVAKDIARKFYNEENPNIAYRSVRQGILWADQHTKDNIVEQLTAFAQHLNKRGAFREDLCMDFEHEAQSFIEMQNNKEL